MKDPRGLLFDRLAAGAVVLVALAARGWYLLQLSTTPLFTQLRLDPLYYHEWALRIAGGDWLSGREVFEQSPLYAYVLALIYRVAGAGPLAPRIVQAIVGSGTCLLVYFIARRVLGRPAALASGLLMALYAPAIFYDGMIMKECWSAFLTAAMTAALVHSEGSRRGLLFLAGATLGLASLMRDNLILLAPLLAAWLVADLFVRAPLAAGRAAEGLARVAVFLLGVALAILPVTVRNYVVSGNVVLLTTGGGEVFYIGNNPEADGKYSPPPFVRATSGVEHEDFRSEAARRLGHPVTRSEASSYWLSEGLRWIAGHPLDYARLIVRKILIFLNGYELPDNQNFYHHRVFSSVLRSLPTWAVLLPLAAAGAAILLPAWREVLPLHLIALGYAGTVMLFFNFARFRMPLVPLLAVFAGEAIVEAPLLFGRRDLRTLVTASLAGGAALVVALLPAGNDPLHRGQSAAQLADLMAKSGRWEEASRDADASIALLESVYLGAGGPMGPGGHGVVPVGSAPRPPLGPSFYGILMDAYEVRSRVAASRKEGDEALAWIERATVAAPDDDIGLDVLGAYGEALLDHGRIADAIAPLRRAHEAEPGDLRLALLYGQALHRSGRPKEALDVVEHALDRNPHPAPLDLADANFGLALIYRDLGDLPRMRLHLRETLDHNPNHPRAAWIRQILAEEETPLAK